MKNLSNSEVGQLMEMLDISESAPMPDRQEQAAKSADDAMTAMVREHGRDEMLGACARFLRQQLFDAVERC